MTDPIRSSAQAYLGLGSNLGDREATLGSAITQLSAAVDVSVRHVSTLYETPPWGPVPQGPYLNACIGIETRLSPRELLELCLAIERRHGRERLLRWGPRTLDIDLLLYGAVSIDEPGLTVPHPHLTERAFVLVPLAEIAPGLVVAGHSLAHWVDALDDQDRAAVRRFEASGSVRNR